jgi:hypothetical protein
MTPLRLQTLPLRRIALALLLPLAVLAAWPRAALSGDGHDHGERAMPAQAALPRFTATSEAFELVGVIDGKQLTLYLDHAPTNAPVKDARLALSVGGVQVVTKAQGEGEFSATLAEAPKPGVTPVTATITAGNESDLLAGEIDIHAEEHADGPAPRSWQFWAACGAGAAVMLAGLAAWRKRRIPRFGETA